MEKIHSTVMEGDFGSRMPKPKQVEREIRGNQLAGTLRAHNGDLSSKDFILYFEALINQQTREWWTGGAR